MHWYLFVGRCYETAALYYRLNKGQIFTIENEVYVRDRENFEESGFYFEGNGYVELDQFIEHCFSDPSLCTSGLSLSLYTKIDRVASASDTLLRCFTPLHIYMSMYVYMYYYYMYYYIYYYM